MNAAVHFDVMIVHAVCTVARPTESATVHTGIVVQIRQVVFFPHVVVGIVERRPFAGDFFLVEVVVQLGLQCLALFDFVDFIRIEVVGQMVFDLLDPLLEVQACLYG
ncbi:MAG: hypothetical protein Q7S19_01085 [bacterium]|nr:hypothetical protein [bacterium]